MANCVCRVWVPKLDLIEVEEAFFSLVPCSLKEFPSSH